MRTVDRLAKAVLQRRSWKIFSPHRTDHDEVMIRPDPLLHCVPGTNRASPRLWTTACPATEGRQPHQANPMPCRSRDHVRPAPVPPTALHHQSLAHGYQRQPKSHCAARLVGCADLTRGQQRHSPCHALDELLGSRLAALILHAIVLRLARQQVMERGVQIVDLAFLDQLVYQRQCTADA